MNEFDHKQDMVPANVSVYLRRCYTVGNRARTTRSIRAASRRNPVILIFMIMTLSWHLSDIMIIDHAKAEKEKIKKKQQ